MLKSNGVVVVGAGVYYFALSVGDVGDNGATFNTT